MVVELLKCPKHSASADGQLTARACLPSYIDPLDQGGTHHRPESEENLPTGTQIPRKIIASGLHLLLCRCRRWGQESHVRTCRCLQNTSTTTLIVDDRIVFSNPIDPLPVIPLQNKMSRD
jgi:hypothetical protein